MPNKLISRWSVLTILTLTLALAGAAPAAAAQRSHTWTSPWSWLMRWWQAATGMPGPIPNGGTSEPGGRGAGLDPDGR